MMRVSGLQKSFVSGKGKSARTVQAVAEVSFAAADGYITGLLGPNGAGKTTTMRMIAGLIAPDAGVIEIDGISGAQERHRMLSRLGVLSDARGLYARLTARENIAYYAGLHGMSDAATKARIDALVEMLDLGGIIDRRTEGFSQGERMKTSLARALVHDPQNLILDEPTNGLDVLATRALREALRGLRAQGKCIVISTHIMQEVERLCDTVFLIAEGRVVAHDTVEGLKHSANQTDFEEAFVALAFPGATS